MSHYVPRNHSMPSLRGKAGAPSFTLVEVVLALGIASFTLVTMLGLLSVGLTTSKTSSDEIQAANIASLLVSARRGAPLDTTNLSGFGLPNLNQAYSTNFASIDASGSVTSENAADYNLMACVGTNSTTGPGLARVYLLLWRPVGSPLPTNNPAGCYELSTSVALP